jgi:E3 ubiquitin-protein ligase RNF5
MEKKNYIECFICMEESKKPVVGACGHIYCWRCINVWLKDKEKHCCPVCRNGINIDKLIRLYANGDDGAHDDDDKGPVNERIPPVVNSNSYSFV